MAARADAVWVGWGFVAEHASFAQRCEEAGIVFVGPDSATIRLLADKVAAKRLAERVGVPVVPWSGGPSPTSRDAAAHARRLGYPVLLKASRGRRRARHPAGPRARRSWPRRWSRRARRRCSPSATRRVFLEAFVPAARHVEVQVIADHHGTIWAVGVRDCSIQRRNQKVIEESGVHRAGRRVRAGDQGRGRAAGVRGGLPQRRHRRVPGRPGDPRRSCSWRSTPGLQVEHPVTEETTGIDLVKLQLHVACGGRLDPAPAAGPGARHRGPAVRRGPGIGLPARTGSDRAAAAADRPGHPGRQRDRRGRRGRRRTSTR